MTPASAGLAARSWLKLQGETAAAPARRAWLFLAADGVAAVGFAAGLALGVEALPRGLVAAAPWLALILAAVVWRGLALRASARAGARAALAVKTQARRTAVAALLGLGAAPGGGAAMTTAVEGVEALDGHFARFAPARAAAVLVPLALIAATAVASPVAAAIELFTLLPFVVAMALTGLAAADQARQQFLALSRLSGLFLDRVRALPVVLAFQAEDAAARGLADAAEDLRARTLAVLRVAFLSSAALEFFAALSVALVAVYCGFNLLRLLPFPVPEALDLQRALFVLALAPEVYAPMRRLAAAYHDRQAAEAAAVSLAALPPAPPPVGPLVLAPAPTIRFAAVSVTYPEAEAATFDRFDLTVAPGRVTVLIGPSGGGKSTLLNLLLGLAPLSGGEVWADDLALSRTGGFAPAVAWVGQSPLVLPASLADNIALARRDATRAEIEAVALEVGLIGAAAARPEGLDARLDERGGGLSGGERRRLALARALLKPCPILLLDEPTANLDAAAERALLPVIARAARGRTTLIATHSAAVAGLGDHVVRLG